MKTYSKFISEEPVPNTPYTKKIYHIFNSGSCQCIKDCDCIKDKGKFLGIQENYTHPLSDKSFTSYESCEESYKAKLH